MSDIIDRAADEISGWPIGTGYYGTRIGVDEAREIAQALYDAGLLREIPTRELMSVTLQTQFGGFLAHDPYDPEIFWNHAADAVLALLGAHDDCVMEGVGQCDIH